jgi:hypothetical protein
MLFCMLCANDYPKRTTSTHERTHLCNIYIYTYIHIYIYIYTHTHTYRVFPEHWDGLGIVKVVCKLEGRHPVSIANTELCATPQQHIAGGSCSIGGRPVLSVDKESDAHPFRDSAMRD